MPNKRVQEAMNRQMDADIYFSSLYFSISSYFESINRRGFANWMRVPVLEKFYDYVNERDGDSQQGKTPRQCFGRAIYA